MKGKKLRKVVLRGAQQKIEKLKRNDNLKEE